MTVIVTDHHEVPFEEHDGKKIYLLPKADAIVDPKQEDCAYPFKSLCGTGVAYQLMTLLFRRMKRTMSHQEIFYNIRRLLLWLMLWSLSGKIVF